MDKLKEIINNGIIEAHLSADITVIRKSLLDYGVDLSINAERQTKLVKQLQFKLKAVITEEKDVALMRIAVESFQEAISKGLEKPIAYLNNLISENRLAVQYSNLEKLDEEEIKQIIKDQNLIEIIELLEEK
jgi:hypothetical protein